MKHTVNKLKWGLSTLHDCDGVMNQVPQLDSKFWYEVLKKRQSSGNKK